MIGNAFLPAGYSLGDVSKAVLFGEVRFTCQCNCGRWSAIEFLETIHKFSKKGVSTMFHDVDDMIFGETPGLHSDR